MNEDNPPLDIKEDMSLKVALFYICENRVWYQMTDIFKAKAQVEYTEWKTDVQQAVSEQTDRQPLF